MKEITRVHLAKTPYSIELDAKKELEKYLAAIEKNMRADADTLREIEVRMVELLAERGVSADKVISGDDVAALREQMGEPKEFLGEGEEPAEEVVDVEASATKPVKRLMRDTDNAMLGGICSGLAAYFGVDVVWMRLAAIALVIVSAGTATLFYILAWMLMPAARTTAEKLQLRGEPVTLDSIKQFATNEEVREKTTTVGVKFLQVLLGLGALFVAIGAFIALVVGAALGFNIVMSMSGLNAQGWAWGLLMALVAGGVALVTLASLLARSAFSWKLGKASGMAMIAMLVVGAISISSIALLGVQTKHEVVRDEKRLTKVVPIELPEDLEGVKYAELVGPASLNLTNNRSDIRAELRYFGLRDAKPPKVSVERNGETLNVVVEDNDLEQWCMPHLITGWSSCLGISAEVRFYGPIDYYVDESYEAEVDVSDYEVEDQD